MLRFIKMHSLGNDFIILDGRKLNNLTPEKLALVRLADRRIGIGCDQIIWLQHSDNADISMRIINADGGEVAACGNATRCVGWLMMEERGSLSCRIETIAGILSCGREYAGSTDITADMGRPRLEWDEIPLAHETDTLHLPLEGDPTAVSMGNPHLVFFVPEVEAVPLKEIGYSLEHHKLFPQRTNVEFVQIMRPDYLKMRVWERGVGMTMACGTGACAALVGAVRRGLAAEKAIVCMPGGELSIQWHKNKEKHWITMAGPVYTSFRGEIVASDYRL